MWSSEDHLEIVGYTRLDIEYAEEISPVGVELRKPYKSRTKLTDIAGLLVGDMYKVSRPIFDIPGLRSFGHIGFCKGYAVFDCSPGQCQLCDLTLRCLTMADSSQ